MNQPEQPSRKAVFFVAVCMLLQLVPGISWCATVGEDGFVPLFNGTNLAGWAPSPEAGKGFIARDGVLICEQGASGNLFTEKTYSDFVLRFEFKLSEGANNGIGIRAPLEGDAAYVGMEIQILDEAAALAGKWGSLRPEQFHGSIYDVVPAAHGALKPAGQWNEEEISAIGRNIKVTVNGTTIMDADLNQITDPAKLAKHPGLLQEGGHIGLLAHGDLVEFRNLRVKELPEARPPNVAPPGFTSLFNGHDLTGWKGLIGGPPKLAEMSRDERSEAQAKADELMRQDWKVEEGSVFYTGSGFDNLVSEKAYGDFELLVDWKLTPPQGDSGIYLRGVPQVQIWADPEGSGGLWNNKEHSSKPLEAADHPVGEWNRFRVLMQGDDVTVWLNDALVVNHVPLENYWDRNAPLYQTGPIELQAHRDKVYFRNIFIRELPR